MGLKRIPRDLVLSLWWAKLLEVSRTRAYVVVLLWESIVSKPRKEFRVLFFQS